jgi:hypothetical protein
LVVDNSHRVVGTQCHYFLPSNVVVDNVMLVVVVVPAKKYHPLPILPYLHYCDSFAMVDRTD